MVARSTGVHSSSLLTAKGATVTTTLTNTAMTNQSDTSWLPKRPGNTSLSTGLHG